MTANRQHTVGARQWQRAWNAALRQRFVIMFFAFLSFFALMPLLEEVREEAWPGAPHLLRLLLFVGTLGAVLVSLCATRRSALATIILAVATSVLWYMPGSKLGWNWNLIRHILAIGFVSYSIGFILLLIFNSSRVTINLLCAALCVYLLLGIDWAIVYSLMNAVNPNSFFSTVPGRPPSVEMRIEAHGSMEAMYYSFATLTTLGYGDIVPISRVARLFAAFEAVVGQLYLTVLVAQLVGMHIVHKTSRTSPTEL